MRISWAGLGLVLLTIATGASVARSPADGLLLAALVVVFLAAARTQRTFAADAVDAKLVPALVLLPTSLSFVVFKERGVTILLVGLLILALLQRTRGQGSLRHPLLLLTLLTAAAIPATRPGFTVTTEINHVLVLLVLVVCATRVPLQGMVFSLVDGIGLYLIANVLAHVAGIQSSVSADRTYGLQSSTGGLRVFFPLATSLAVPPLMAAVFVAAGMICFQGRGLVRVFRAVAFFAAVYVMIAANTRSAVIVSALVLAASVFLPRFFARVAVPVAAVPLALSFVYGLAIVAVQPVVSYLASVLPFLSRGDVSSDVALAGRNEIWSSSLTFWESVVGSRDRLLGFGELGRQSSGAAAAYAQGDPTVLSFSSHNSLLQQLFDGGLVGVAALAAAALAGVAVMASGGLRSSRGHAIGLSALVACLLGGGTEVTISPGYGQVTFWVFAALVVAAAADRWGGRSPQATSGTIAPGRLIDRGDVIRPSPSRAFDPATGHLMVGGSVDEESLLGPQDGPDAGFSLEEDPGAFSAMAGSREKVRAGRALLGSLVATAGAVMAMGSADTNGLATGVVVLLLGVVLASLSIVVGRRQLVPVSAPSRQSLLDRPVDSHHQARPAETHMSSGLLIGFLVSLVGLGLIAKGSDASTMALAIVIAYLGIATCALASPPEPRHQGHRRPSTW